MQFIQKILIMLGAVLGLSQFLFAATAGDRSPDIYRDGCWEKTFEDSSIQDITSDSRLILVARGGGKLTAIETTSGEGLWTAELGGEFASNVLPTTAGIAVMTVASNRNVTSGSLRLLSRQTGIPIWSMDLGMDRVSLLTARDNVIAVNATGVISSYLLGTGKINWERKLNERIVEAAAADSETMLLGTGDGKVLLVNFSDGSTSAARDLGKPPTSLISLGGDDILVGDPEGRIFAVRFDEKNSEWEFRNGGRISSFATSRFGTITTSFDNFVYMLTRNGDVRWKRRLTGRLNTGAAIGSSVALVPAENEGIVFVLKLKDGKVLDQVRMYAEGTQNRLFARALAGDSFVIADADTLRNYSPFGCVGNEKKQPNK